MRALLRPILTVLLLSPILLGVSARPARAQTLAALPAGAEVRLTTIPLTGPIVQSGRLLAVTRDSVFVAGGGDAALRFARPDIRTAEVQSPDYVLRALVGLAIGLTAGFAANPNHPSPGVIAAGAVPAVVVGAFALPFTRWHGIVP